MLRSLRRLLGVLLLLALTALTGCGRVSGTVQIHPDDSADVRIEVSAAESDQAVVKAVTESCVSQTAPVPKVYREKGRVGCRVSGRLTAQKLSNLGISVYSTDGVQRFEMRRPQSGSDDPALKNLEELLAGLTAPADFEMRVSFRGEVLKHSGGSTVEGRTVVWNRGSDLAQGLRAEAKSPGILDRSPGEWAMIALGFLAFAGFAGWVIRDVMRHDRVERPAPWGGPRFVRRR